MANYEACANSNEFAVKDTKKFQELCNTWGFEASINENMCQVYFEEGLPDDQRYDEETGESIEDDFYAAIQPLLADGHVAIFQEIGHIRRDMNAYGVVVSSTDIKCLGLSELLMNTAEEMGTFVQAI